ncbi:MAG: hypothetical protein JRJ84_05755 [Deltaproteobacteria bacterium]|nr:hypothetical protein [Deltaproteobacteria bacterium]
MRILLFLAFSTVFGLAACDSQLTPLASYDDSWMDEPGLDIPIDRDYGKPLLQVVPEDYRSVGVNAYGPPSWVSRSTEVWEVTGRWYHRTDEAGIAWSENSGLSWDEKYARWVDGLEQTTGDNGYVTAQLTTPWGKTLPSPALECAEMGMFFRATFASWYNLPFFMSAWHPTYGTLHYGHFGVVTHAGQRVSGTPWYRTAYEDKTDDYANANDAYIVENWPQDEALRAKYLTSAKDDAVDFLGEDAYAGAYFDEIFLNKRVGHFMLRLLTNFGSMHVASAKNTFNLVPAQTREGDLLVERWQSNGIGHVMVVKEVATLSGGKMNAEIMFGSMPRIQPKWYGPSISKSYFTDQMTGGSAQSGEGVAYAQLGGGLKRWRTPVVKGGRWVNIVPSVDRTNHYIGSTNYAAIGSRPDIFKQLLGQLSADEEREVLIERIELQRDNLSQRPASCASRIRREDAFEDLYALMSSNFGKTKEQVDKEYRTDADYVLAELVYNQSKTCCWNSTTHDMYEIVMGFNHQLIEQAASNECPDLAVFKARNGDYAVFRDYAESVGKGHLWVAWSEDESCPQRDTQTDTEADPEWTDFCDIAADITGADIGGGTGSDSGSDSSDPCGGLDWNGECSGNTVRWCDEGEVYEHACESGETCGWLDYYGYYWCE